jgi:hypothetical protein
MGSNKRDDHALDIMLDYAGEIGKPITTWRSQEINGFLRKARFSEKYETRDVVGEVYKDRED